jgi:hypothetical protein
MDHQFLRDYYQRVLSAEQELLSVIGMVERRFGHLRTASDDYAKFLDMLDRKRSDLLESHKLANRS